jgi:hypothetical protein
MEPTLLREMLFQIEAHPAGKVLYRFKIDGRDEAEILEHVQLLIDADFIEGKVMRTGMGRPERCSVKRLTLRGHQFLANARNDTIWKKVMAQAKEKGMSTSMTVINGLLETAAKKYVGLE